MRSGISNDETAFSTDGKDFEPYPTMSRQKAIREASELLETSLALAAETLAAHSLAISQLRDLTMKALQDSGDPVLQEKLKFLFDESTLKTISATASQASFHLNNAVKENQAMVGLIQTALKEIDGQQ